MYIVLLKKTLIYIEFIFINMNFWKEETPLQFIASCIWNTSEILKIPLGRFAPTIFEWMIGYKKTKL